MSEIKCNNIVISINFHVLKQHIRLLLYLLYFFTVNSSFQSVQPIVICCNPSILNSSRLLTLVDMTTTFNVYKYLRCNKEIVSSLEFSRLICYNNEEEQRRTSCHNHIQVGEDDETMMRSDVEENFWGVNNPRKDLNSQFCHDAIWSDVRNQDIETQIRTGSDNIEEK